MHFLVYTAILLLSYYSSFVSVVTSVVLSVFTRCVGVRFYTLFVVYSFIFIIIHSSIMHLIDMQIIIFVYSVYTHSTFRPDIMKCRCNRCAISSLTLDNEALLPCIFKNIDGCTLPSPSIRSVLISPPATCKKGRTPSNTTSICSSFERRSFRHALNHFLNFRNAFSESSFESHFHSLRRRRTCPTGALYNNRNVVFQQVMFSLLTYEWFIHVSLHTCNSSRTTGPSISAMATFPPS